MSSVVALWAVVSMPRSGSTSADLVGIAVGFGLTLLGLLAVVAARRRANPMWDAERVKDAGARFRRFETFFRVQVRMWELVNALLDQETIKLRGGTDRDLSLLVGASLGKALKTFQGVHELCLTGWGEDALILLRSNVNLLINLGFILSDPEPSQRADDFIAFSYLERVKYLKTCPATPATLDEDGGLWKWDTGQKTDKWIEVCKPLKS